MYQIVPYDVRFNCPILPSIKNQNNALIPDAYAKFNVPVFITNKTIKKSSTAVTRRRN